MAVDQMSPFLVFHDGNVVGQLARGAEVAAARYVLRK